MLTLDRKPGETICIGANIRITILGIDKQAGKVRLGFEAPEDVTILREEVYQRNLDAGGQDGTHRP